MNTVLFFLGSILFWVLIGFGAVWLSVYFRRGRTRTNRPASLTARVTEMIALGGISFALLVMLVMYRCYDPGTPYALSDVAPPNAKMLYWSIVALLSILTMLLLLVAWFRRTSLACFLLTIFFCGAGFVVNEGYIFSYKNHVEAIRATPIPIEITLNDNIRGAKVWVNGIYLGKTPTWITAEDLFQKVPRLEKPPKEWNGNKKVHYNAEGHGFRPFVWTMLTPPTQVLSDDKMPKYQHAYFHVELNGEEMYNRSGHGQTWLYPTSAGSRLAGQIKPGVIRLNLFLPRWDEEVELLVQRARLADYQVDEAWIAAAESYDTRVWEVMRQKSETEPELNRALDAWTTHRYKLDGVRGPDSARDVFEHIATEAEKQGYYNSDSPMGRAIELLIPFFDVESFVEEAETRLASFDRGPRWEAIHNIAAGRPFFAAKSQQKSLNPVDITMRDAVLAHVIWKLDDRLDLEDKKSDNLVEQRIVPSLLRLDIYTNDKQELAQLLGGSVFKKFVTRQTPHNPSQIENRLTEGYIDPWWLANVSRDTEAGRAYRKRYANEILDVTKQIVQEHHDFRYTSGRKLPSTIDYLFLDLPNHELCLAVRFWPDFDRYAFKNNADDSGGAQGRWAYLCRIASHSKPEAFVEIYRQYADHRVIQGYVDECVLMTLEPTLRLEVAEALLAEAEKLASECKPDSEKFYLYQANANDFRRLKFLVPCEASADAMLDWLNEKSKNRWQRIQQVEQMAKKDQLSKFHLRKLAKAKNSKLRQLVLPQIQKRPTSERRKLLQELLKDDDKTVQAEAERLDQKLKDLADQPLPVRK